MRARYAVSVRMVASSSSPMRRLYPATSVLKIAASLRSIPTAVVWSGIAPPGRRLSGATLGPVNRKGVMDTRDSQRACSRGLCNKGEISVRQQYSEERCAPALEFVQQRLCLLQLFRVKAFGARKACVDTATRGS